jgi:hypothetical protein
MPNNIRNQPMYLQSGDPESENAVTLAYPGMLGGRLTVKEPGPPGSPTTAGQYRPKTYQLVQTDSSMSVNPFAGAVAWWSDKTKYLVTTSPTALGRGRIAGVFRNAITPGNYGCIQIQGPCPNVKYVDAPTAAPSAAGLFVIPSATAGKADCLAAGSAATYPVLGLSSGVIPGADSTGPVDLDVPETP